MKINFKKLAITAGVTAAMAAGSMSAHAVITAVPAPAQLVPLFYFNADPANSWDTDVRITVPRAVGADSVISLLTGQRNGITNIALDTSWNTATGAFVPTVIGGNTVAANELHWFWMNNRSEEIANGIIPVTPDDSVWISAENLATGAVVGCGNGNGWADQQCAAVTNQGGAASGQAGYLILSNQSAFGGGAPQFAFAADAWVENRTPLTGGIGYPDTFSIPVLGLADDVDTTSYVTPTNNLIQNYPASALGPIASPIHTGIRTSSTGAGFKYRVVDLPVHDRNFYNNTLVAWVDTNAPLTGTGALIGNGASGRLFGIGRDEEFSSLPSVSLPNQLNIVRLGWDVPGYRATPAANTTIGITNSCGTSCTSDKAANPLQVAALGSLGAAANGGFLKFVLDTKALPNGGTGLAPGAYSSMIMFNVPSAITQVAPLVTGDEEAPMMGIDTGFFTQN